MVRAQAPIKGLLRAAKAYFLWPPQPSQG